MIRRKDKSGQLRLTDIANPAFQPTDIALKTLMREIHGRLPNGQYVTGVEVFRQIYDRIGFRFLVAPTRWPLVSHCLAGMYQVFAWLRFHHALRRMKQTGCSLVGHADETGVSCRQPLPASKEDPI